MDHDHFIVISLRHRTPPTVRLDLMRLKLNKGPVLGDVGNRPEQRLVRGRIVQPNHEKFVMPMRIGEFDTAIHRELEGRAVDPDSGCNLNPFIRLVWASLGELAEAHKSDADLIDVQFFDRGPLGGHRHGEGGPHLLRNPRPVIKCDERHEVIAPWRA